MRRANKKDKSQAGIVKGLREHGYSVFDMPEPGDILCYGPHVRLGGDWLWMPMECKSDQATRHQKKELTPAQEVRAKFAPIPIVHDLREALKLYGIELEMT